MTPMGYILLALLVATNAATWSITHRLDQTAQLHAVNVQLQADVAAQTTMQREAHTREESLNAALSAIDAQYIQKLQESENEKTNLRTAIANGTARLRVAANCPSRVSATSSNSSGSSVDTDTAPELTADAQEAYFSLSDGIDHQYIQLTACQAELTKRSALSEPASN
jgi:prophage endopeptidase